VSEAQVDRVGKPNPVQEGSVMLGPIVLSDARRWVDSDGAHHIQSLEFDLTGSGESLAEAVESFNASAADLLLYLLDLVRGNEATEREIRDAALLSERFTEGARAWQRETTRHAALHLFHTLGRRRGIRQDRYLWHPARRPTSSQLSHA
jgi:hypothetical protein